MDLAEVVIDENANVEAATYHPSSDHAYSSLVTLSNRPSEQSLMRVRALNYEFGHFHLQ